MPKVAAQQSFDILYLQLRIVFMYYFLRIKLSYGRLFSLVFSLALFAPDWASDECLVPRISPSCRFSPLFDEQIS